MNFSQWCNYAAKNDVSKVTYCCGDEYVLVDLVAQDIKNILQVPVTDFVVVDASQSTDFWEIASQYPLNPDANRLTVVKNADQVKSWDGLYDWLAQSRNNPKNFLLFLSNQADAPGIFAKGKKVSYADHIELIRTKGKFIKCSTPNDDDLLKWVCSYGLSQNSAEFLIERTSGDTALLLDVLKKVPVWAGSPSPKALALLCEEQALDSFADYLILRDKASAFLALRTMSDEEKAKIISRLDYRLDTLTELGRCLRRRMFDADIAASTGIKIYLVKRFKSVAKDYDDKKIKYCRQVLTIVDGAIRDGAKVGVWETLITLW
jgi:DNA polymerase III delta subunit